MTEPGEELFDEVIIHISAWRRLRHSIKEVAKSDPEKYGEIAGAFLMLMDLSYREAAEDLKKKKASLEHNLEKIRENSRYGRFGE